MKLTKQLNKQYTGLMGAYSMAYAVFSAYGTVYLLAKDFNETEIGLIIAVANIFAAVIQPVVADWADRSTKWTLKEFNLMFILPMLVLLSSIQLNNQAFFLVGIQFMLSYTLLLTVQPLLNAISMFVVNQGYAMNYGFSRAMGSLAYAVSSAVLGIITVRWGMDAVMPFTLLAISLYLITLLYMPIRWLKDHPETGLNETAAPGVPELTEMPVDISEVPISENFIKRYRNFMLINVGIGMFFVFHSLVNTYMFQVLAQVGGDRGDMGIAFALAALVEIPVMMAYGSLRQKVTDEQAMMISAVFFFVKALITFLAVNVLGVMVAQAMQAMAFALYITVSVIYTNKVMSANDKVKGQAVLTTSHTIGGVVGSLAGGILIQQFSVKTALVFGLLMTIGGVTCFWLGLRDQLRRPAA